MISIIIIVKNDIRIETLLNKLNEVKKPGKYEVIVVDASQGKLNYIRDKFHSISWYDYVNENKSRTYAEQRNLGISKAKGNIIVFIDADCIPEEFWLVNLTKPIFEGHEDIVSGACKPISNSHVYKEEQYGAYRDECETMNIAISRKVIKSVGFFDEHLEGCEDSDFCLRARARGFKIKYEKDAIIYHDWGGIKKNIYRSYNGGRDRVHLYSKYKKLILEPTLNNFHTLYYVIFIIFIFIVFIYPIYLTLLFIPSIIKRRNPLKELYNLFFALGVIKETLQLILFTLFTNNIAINKGN